MPTIAHITEKAVANKPFLQEALYRGIINYQSLAEELHPAVEQEIGEKVKLSAVMIALRRYAEKLEQQYVKEISFGPEAALDMKSSIIEISVKKSDSIFSLMPKLFAIVDFSDGGILNFTNGNYDVSIVTNQRYKAKMLEVVAKEKIIDINEHLVAVSFHYSKKMRTVPGMLHNMLRILAWEHINIIELIETMTESIFILNQEDGLRAFKSLQTLVTH